MSDENKNVENNQEENQNREECNKKWWEKLLGLKPTYKCCLILFLIAFIVIIAYVCIKVFSDIPDKGKWIVAPVEMSKKRSFATANLLPDGNVLIMGGEDNSADTADIFDPNQMKIVKTIKLSDKRYFGYSAITLKNGDVFVAGGYIFPEKRVPFITNTTMLFDYKKYLFKETEPMKEHPSDIKTFLLENGHVLILHNPHNHLLEEIKKREHIKFQVYDPIKNEYYETKNTIHRLMVGKQYMILDNGDILFKCFYRLPEKTDKGLGSTCLYNWKENKFEVADEIPHERLFIQLDSENYLTMTPGLEHTEGYTYNIKTKKKTRVKNKINRTFYSASSSIPKMILLANGNVLIAGISLKKLPPPFMPNNHEKSNYDYSTYIYNKKENFFYEIPSPKIEFDNWATSVMLENGDIVVLGGRSDDEGKKIQIYKYRH